MVLVSAITISKFAFIFRESMLLNGILTNLEVWHPVTNVQLEILEKVDQSYLKKILKSHSKTPKEALYLETGLLPIRYVAMRRRLMYLHNILIKPEKELIKKVYAVQKILPTKGDWYKQVMEDKNKLGLDLSDVQISRMSKDQFKELVAVSVRNYALNCLNQNVTKNENSKCRRLAKKDLVKENYFIDNRFSKSECELLFALRTRMIPGIKKNFSSQYADNLICELCSALGPAYPDTQEHLLSCAKLRMHVKIPDNLEYEDIYRNVEKQIGIVKVVKQLLRVREILLCEEEFSSSDEPSCTS